MAIFDRDAIFLKWDYVEGTPAYEKCFRVLMDGHSHAERKPAQYTRSWYDNRLLIVRASTQPHLWRGAVLAYHEKGDAEEVENDGADDIYVGDIDHLKLAWLATDLQVKAHEDSAYWTAEWVGEWNPILDYDPYRNYSAIVMSLEGKA